MPQWFVSQPLLSLWVSDVPLFYQPSRGPALTFKLFYKNERQESEWAEDTALVFSVGRNWASPWRCFLRVVPENTNSFRFINGIGGVTTVTNGGSAEYRMRLTCAIEGGVPVIRYPTGGKDTFGEYVVDGTEIRYFLTRREDSAGNATLFQYGRPDSMATCLTNVVDVDGYSTSLSYTNIGWYYLVSEVRDRYGRQVTLQYEEAWPVPNLIGITDAFGLPASTLVYGGGGMSGLITPYGTNQFYRATNSTTAERALLVCEQEVRHQLYLFQATNSTETVPSSYAAWRPSTTNGAYFAISNTLDAEEAHQRNTFHWGPKACEYLPSGFLTNLIEGTLDIAALAATNYLHALQRHWLCKIGSDGVWELSNTLSLQRDPSPEGATQGQITWYDYAGKPSGTNWLVGSASLPQLEGWLLPEGQARFTRWQRNGLGYPTNEIATYNDSAGVLRVRTNAFGYAANEIDVITHTNALGVQVSSNVYNGFHQVLTNYNALGELTLYSYDTNQQITGIRLPSGLIVTNRYDAVGWLTNVVEYEHPEGGSAVYYATNTYTYTNGQVYTHTDPRGLRVTNTWDALGRLTQVDYPDQTSARWGYQWLDLVEVVDRLGQTNRFEYDGFRQRVRSIDALDRTNTYAYCTCGVLESHTDPLDQTTVFAYDLLGRRTNAILYGGAYTIAYGYDLMGRQTNVTDSFGSVIRGYNNQGLLKSMTNAAGQVTAVLYDILDRPTNQVDASGVTVTNTYDSLDRLSSRTRVGGGTDTFEYGPRGLTNHVNGLGTNTWYAYDALGRKTNEVSPGIATNRFTYSAAGDLVSLADGKGQVTAWAYDVYGRVTQKIDDNEVVILEYEYDAEGRLTNRWSLAKGDTRFEYDAVGNVRDVDYPVSTDLSFEYDALNRVTNMVDAIGTTSYAYEEGQRASEDGPWALDTVSSIYESGRLRSGLSVEAPNSSAWVQSYAYDGAKRLTNVTSAAGVFGYQYHSGMGGVTAASRLIQRLDLGNGAVITNAFDGAGRWTETVLRTGGGTLRNRHAYGYNAANQRTAVTNDAGNGWAYAYDGLGQLTGAVGRESGGTTRLQEQFGYAYDAAGNLSQRTNNALVQSFSVNNLNQLSGGSRSGTLTVAGMTTPAATNVTINSLSATLYGDATFAREGFTITNGLNSFTAVAEDALGRTAAHTVSVNLPASPTFAYDDNGNLVSDGRRGFAYDDENQLASVTVTNAAQTKYAYDGRMRLRVRTECVWQNSAWATNAVVRYVYDGMLVVQERDGNNLPVATYTRGQDLSGSFEGAGGIGGLLARTDNGLLLGSGSPLTHVCYHADGNGNVTALTGGGEQIAGRYVYDPYGNLLGSQGPMAEANRYRFSSKEWHTNAALYYYGYRFYEPSLQRWLNRDPLTDLSPRATYRFALNSPLHWHDPFGLSENADWGETFDPPESGQGRSWPATPRTKCSWRPPSIVLMPPGGDITCVTPALSPAAAFGGAIGVMQPSDTVNGHTLGDSLVLIRKLFYDNSSCEQILWDIKESQRPPGAVWIRNPRPRH